jgi:hypothetical protein
MKSHCKAGAAAAAKAEAAAAQKDQTRAAWTSAHGCATQLLLHAVGACDIVQHSTAQRFRCKGDIPLVIVQISFPPTGTRTPTDSALNQMQGLGCRGPQGHCRIHLS